MDTQDTIAAIASAPGPAARGIVRLSGPRVLRCLQRCFRPDDGIELDNLRRPTVVSGHVELPDLDRSLPADLHYWPTSRSYTRQPSAELHTFGSPPLLDAALSAVCAAGARPALPGEFTLRSFLAGRIDLTQAEAVLGVINASGQSEFDVALAQLAGGLSGPLHELRGELLDLLADLEAGLDFVEEDIEFVSSAETQRRLAGARDRLNRLLGQMDTRHQHASAARVVLVGWPNVGKSSLFNAIVGHRRAIVSHVAGTTRDYLSATIDLDGAHCELIDTAGIDPDVTIGELHELAQRQTSGQDQSAAVRVLCVDSSRPLNAWERAALAARDERPAIVASTKCDLSGNGTAALRGLPRQSIPTSGTTGQGIDALRGAIRQLVIESAAAECHVVPSTVARCRESVRRASVAIRRSQDLLHAGAGEELLAVELRIALDELGCVVGAVCPEDVLERIFSRFCIGK